MSMVIQSAMIRPVSLAKVCKNCPLIEFQRWVEIRVMETTVLVPETCAPLLRQRVVRAASSNTDMTQIWPLAAILMPFHHLECKQGQCQSLALHPKLTQRELGIPPRSCANSQPVDASATTIFMAMQGQATGCGRDWQAARFQHTIFKKTMSQRQGGCLRDRLRGAAFGRCTGFFKSFMGPNMRRYTWNRLRASMTGYRVGMSFPARGRKR